jgi:uncharacterized membrane protein
MSGHTARGFQCDMRFLFEDVAIPLARLLGHSLLAAIGFCVLGAISLIPILLLKLLSSCSGYRDSLSHCAHSK